MIKATPTQVLLQLVGCEVYDSCLCGHCVYKGLWTKEKDFFVEQRLLLSKSLMLIHVLILFLLALGVCTTDVTSTIYRVLQVGCIELTGQQQQ